MGLGGWHLVSLGSILIRNARHLDGVHASARRRDGVSAEKPENY